MTEMPIGEAIAKLADEAPDAPILSASGKTVTRDQFEKRTNRLARCYGDLGVRENDLVTILLPNGLEFYEACHAAWKLGATPQMVSSQLPAQELSAIIELANPALIVGLEDSPFSGIPSLPGSYEPDGALDASPLPPKIAQFWRAPMSGGSTGRPKIILSNVPGSTDPDSRSLKIVRDGVMLVPGPLYHSGPFLFSMLGLWRGKHIVVMEKFDPLEALRLIQQYRVDYIQVVPTMMHRIWMLGEDIRSQYDISSLKVLLHLGAACPPWLKDRWIAWLGAEHVFELYAGTEAQGMTWISGKEWLERRGSVGKPIRGCEMCILDDEGNPLPPGEIGEIHMRSSSSADPSYQYIGAEKRTRDDWDSLGDMGYLDTDGYLYIADRRTDMIVSGGANIYPAEVEAALDEYPGIISSAVVGLPDDDLGHRVHAIYHSAG
ncbi:MAG: AMP-binding protein, partial [Pseudomonadales bacterium]